MTTDITLTNLRKEYGAHVAIEDLSLRIEEGEFFTLLGPSGCGKTTLLRMIAGFNSIEGGTISFGDTVVNTLPPGKRNIGMVFQNYALFPQMNAGKNVAFGLENRAVPKADIPPRVQESLESVRMGAYTDRMPGAMSGGQQQRVALARALVIKPAVLLMDEPLSNLDAKLRVEMRETIRAIQEEAGITTVYVTHDQEEAMAVSDRIAVMSEGVVQHVGTPAEIYHRPATLFVADFIGKTNNLVRTVKAQGDRLVVNVDERTEIDITDLVDGVAAGEELTMSVRPEAVTVGEAGQVLATVVHSTFLGSHTQFQVRLGTGEVVEFTEFSAIDQLREPGQEIHVDLARERLNFFGADGRSVTRGVRPR